VRRIGKRIVLEFGDDLFLVIHLMIAGRLRWRVPGQKPGIGPKLILATFQFANGTLFFTEASSKKRASIQLVRGEPALRALDPGGLEPLDATLEQFHDALTRENHTLKRVAHRSASLQRHRQRLFRRDPARGPSLAVEADARAVGRGVQSPVRRDAGDAAPVDSITCASR
jgi:hypothetical protein